MSAPTMRRLADVPLLQGAEYAVTAPELRRAASVPHDEGIDWGLVVVLRRKASEEITREAELHTQTHGTPLADDDRRMLGRAITRRVVRHHADAQSHLGQLWPLEKEQGYAAALEDAIFGYGRLQPLFEIAEAENIEIHGCDSVMVQYGDGHREAHPPVADSDAELVEAIRFLGESVVPPRPFDDAHPTMTLALGDSHRLHAIGFGLSHRPSVTIRQHTLTTVDLPELVDRGMLPDEVGQLLHAAILARKSIVIAGDHSPAREQLLYSSAR